MANEEDEEQEQTKPRAFETLEERMERRRKKASTGKLISYIITLILALALLFWLRSVGKF